MTAPGKAMVQTYLPRISPEEAGLDSSQIASFLEAVRKKGIRLHTFIAAREGRVFAEAYFPPYTPTQLQQVYSLSKSFTSAAVGMAVEDGLLKLTDRVASFFSPDELPKSYDLKLSGLTVRDLLRMATGQAQERWGNRNWVHAFFNEPIADEKSGETFRYNTLATYMCSVILHKRGIDLEAYLLDRLILPLGIEGTRWLRSPQKICTGGFGLSLIPELIVKFGTLLLQDGVWEGKQLLPAWYVREATAKQIETVPADSYSPVNDWCQGYGYQFWQCTHGCFRGDGMYGQFCVVSRDKRLVFAATCFTDDMQGVLDAFYDHVLAPLQDSPLPDDPTAEASLKERYPESGLKAVGSGLAPFAYPVPLPHSQNHKLARALDGKEMLFLSTKETPFAPNLPKALKFKARFQEEVLLLQLGRTTFRAENGACVDFTANYRGMKNTRVIASYTFEGEDTLKVRLFMVELMEDLLLRFTVREGAVELELYDVHNGEENSILTAKGTLR